MPGGFAGVPAAVVEGLSYWRLTGGDPPGEIKPVAADTALLIEQAIAGLARLIARFDDAATPYLAVPDMTRAPAFSDYGHLARIKEWSDPGGEGGAE